MRKETSRRIDPSSVLLDAGLVVWAVALTLSATAEFSATHSSSMIIQPQRTVAAPFANSFDDRWRSLYPAAKTTNYWLTPGPEGHVIARAEEVHT